MPLQLSYQKILAILSENNLLVSHNIVDMQQGVTFVTHDSREVQAGSLFFCKGIHFQQQYLHNALEAGAVCYCAEQQYAVEGSYILVSSIRRAMALIAPLFYGYAYEKLNLVGVTGTKGKTTIAYFLKNIFDTYTGKKTGLLSTIDVYTGKRAEEAHLTTPEPCDLQRYFWEAATSGIDFFTMEVSSQAYKTERVFGMQFDNGIFLNISEDHIGPLEHEDFADYLDCKLAFIRHCNNVLINAETQHLARVQQAAANAQRVTLYGSEKSRGSCDYYYSNIQKTTGGLRFLVTNEAAGYTGEFAIAMAGYFNVENALAAIVMAKTLGVDDNSIREGLLRTSVPGRMNVVENDEITVVVDYAHNLLSFTKLYESLKQEYPGRRIVSVGGSPGGKAQLRRQNFADVVGRQSDYIYITAEDPQYEDVLSICNEMAALVSVVSAVPYEIIPDRAQAISRAIRTAKRGDVVVLLGKGDETYQKINGEYVPCESDLQIAQRLLSAKPVVAQV